MLWEKSVSNKMVGAKAQSSISIDRRTFKVTDWRSLIIPGVFTFLSDKDSYYLASVTKGFRDGPMRQLKAGMSVLYIHEPKGEVTAFSRVSKLVESLHKELRMIALSSHRVEQVGKDIHILPNLFNK